MLWTIIRKFDNFNLKKLSDPYKNNFEEYTITGP